MKNFALFGIFLLSALGCSRQPPREPVTVTFLDIEYGHPRPVAWISARLAGLHTGNRNPR